MNNQAVLNFQMGGKLTYLPFKEGDVVSQGQTIASIDSYALQKSLQTFQALIKIDHCSKQYGL